MAVARTPLTQGRQILDLAVVVGDSQVFGQVVKRDPNAIPVQLTADFSWSILNGGSSSVGLVLKDTTVPVAGSSIMNYEWTFPTVSHDGDRPRRVRDRSHRAGGAGHRERPSS